MTTTEITTQTAEALAEAAGMTGAEYTAWIRSLRARPMADKLAIKGSALLPDEGFTETEVAEGNYKRPTPQHDGPTKTADERYAEVCAWLNDLGRKVEIRDITHANKSVASWWLRRYEGSFEFLNDLKAKGGVRSDGQAKGVLNCIRADLLHAATPAPERAARPATATLDISALPAGRYAFQPADGAQAQFIVVQRPDEGKWAGCTFVKAQHSDDLERAGWQPANSAAYRGTHVAALTEILADPREAMELYGRLLEHCGHCGRTLTNEESRERGIGPVCARAMGW